jgi:hypothetical protein
VTAASPPAPTPPGAVSFLRVAGVIAGAMAFANLAFFGLSRLYFASHTNFVVGVGEIPAFTPADMMSIRLAFLVFTVVVGGAAIAAIDRQTIVGHVLPVLLGIGSFGAGCVSLYRGMPAALSAALIVVGGLLPFLAYRSWNRSRAAWAFLIAICSVYAVVLFFGAPTVHRLLGLGLWTTLILPGLNLVAFVSLIQIRANYRE